MNQNGFREQFTLDALIEIQEIKIQRGHSSNSTVWIIVGVCGGVFLVILAILIFVYCRKKQETKQKRNISKSEISYPNSIGKLIIQRKSKREHTVRMTLISVNGHAVATATRNSQYSSLRSNKQPIQFQYQDQYDSFAHGDGRSTNQSANIPSGRYDNAYGPDSETDSEDEIDKMKREVIERAQGRGSTSESDLDVRHDEQDQMIPRMR